MADCDLTPAGKGKTTTKHMTGDSEVERDLRKMKTAPQALTEKTMTDIMGDELGSPKIVDRSTFQAELDALRVREKAANHCCRSASLHRATGGETRVHCPQSIADPPATDACFPDT